MSTQEQLQEIINRRHEIVFNYRKEKGWSADPSEMTIDQIMEIRSQQNWKDVPKKVEELNKLSSLGDVMPSIGSSYSIIEQGERIFGYVESYQGDTGKFWVKWTDGEITLESKIELKTK